MGHLRWWGFGLVGAALLVPVAAGLLPATADGYRDTAVSAAQEAASATLTAATLSDTTTLSPYARTVLSDAQEDVTTALGRVAGGEVPDDASRGVRDVVLPLLTEAVSEVGDALRAADDPDGLRAHAGPLREVGARLRAFAGNDR